MLPTSEHERLKELCSSYIDDRLNAAERLEIEAHLHDCPECRDELDSLKATVQLLRRVPMAAVPRPFSIPEVAIQRKNPFLPYFRLATAAAAVLLVFVFSMDMFSNLGQVTISVPAAAPSTATLKSLEQSQSTPGDQAAGAGALGAQQNSGESAPQVLPGARNSATEPFATVPAPMGPPLAENKKAEPPVGKSETPTTDRSESTGQTAVTAKGVSTFRIMEIGLLTLVALLLGTTFVISRVRNNR